MTNKAIKAKAKKLHKGLTNKSQIKRYYAKKEFEELIKRFKGEPSQKQRNAARIIDALAKQYGITIGM